MSDALPAPLTRARLRDLIECRRRFWLRHILHLPWPTAPLPAGVEQSVEQGLEFHQVMRRHFLGLDLDLSGLASPVLDWWDAWSRHPLPLPAGRRLPEFTLTAPLGGERLLARFDLLLLPPDGGRAIIVDWKTERRPRRRDELAADIQTRLYPFVLAAGSLALPQPGRGSAIAPDRIEMVYWQAHDPAHPLRFPYSAAAHEENRAAFEALVAEARALSPDSEPPPIEQLSICARCPFATYCGRERTSTGEPDEAEFYDEAELEPTL